MTRASTGKESDNHGTGQLQVYTSNERHEVTEQTANAHVGNAFVLSPVDLAKLNHASAVSGKEPKTPD